MLTDISIRKEKPGRAPRKLYDGRGLCLLLNPDGSRWWRLKYRFGGREKLLSLGVYPAVALKRARTRCDEARLLLVNGVDPAAKRQAEKQATGENFESVAREWLRMQDEKLTSGTLGRERDRLAYLTRNPPLPCNIGQFETLEQTKSRRKSGRSLLRVRYWGR